MQESSTSPDIERRLKELERKVAAIATLKPEERQGLRETINDLLVETQSLRADSNKQAREIEELRKSRKDIEQDIEEIREHFPALVVETKKRVSALEAQAKPKETANNKERINIIAQELLRRAEAKQIGMTYAEAAKILQINKARICQLRLLIAADSRFDIIWHPKKKNTKLICLKNYK